MFMEGFHNETTYEDIIEALKEQFDIDLYQDNAFAFEKVEKRKTLCQIRFVKENAALDLAMKIKEKLGGSENFKIKESAIKFNVLSGQEEIEFLEKIKRKKDITAWHKNRRQDRKRHNKACNQSELDEHLNGKKQNRVKAEIKGSDQI